MDTSVLVSAMLPDHVHHAQTRPWIERAKSGAFELVIGGHSLAEIYSVLTRLPRKPRISPGDALRLLQQNVVPHATVVALTGANYSTLIAELAASGVTGGAVYDAVIAKVAELANVDHLLTLNVAHFQRVWPTGASRVAAPQAIPLP